MLEMKWPRLTATFRTLRLRTLNSWQHRLPTRSWKLQICFATSYLTSIPGSTTLEHLVQYLIDKVQVPTTNIRQSDSRPPDVLLVLKPVIATVTLAVSHLPPGNYLKFYALSSVLCFSDTQAGQQNLYHVNPIVKQDDKLVSGSPISSLSGSSSVPSSSIFRRLPTGNRKWS